MICAGHVACLEEEKNANNVLVTKSEGKRLCERPSVNERPILKLFLQTGWEGQDLTHLVKCSLRALYEY
jgi:hypothetical protein